MPANWLPEETKADSRRALVSLSSSIALVCEARAGAEVGVVLSGWYHQKNEHPTRARWGVSEQGHRVGLAATDLRIQLRIRQHRMHEIQHVASAVADCLSARNQLVDHRVGRSNTALVADRLLEHGRKLNSTSPRANAPLECSGRRVEVEERQFGERNALQIEHDIRVDDAGARERVREKRHGTVGEGRVLRRNLLHLNGASR
eukprot:scaffold233077_cov28-Tisochrysis_lutea.AAC.2